jgi:hypothetical protein
MTGAAALFVHPALAQASEAAMSLFGDGANQISVGVLISASVLSGLTFAKSSPLEWKGEYALKRYRGAPKRKTGTQVYIAPTEKRAKKTPTTSATRQSFLKYDRGDLNKNATNKTAGKKPKRRQKLLGKTIDRSGALPQPAYVKKKKLPLAPSAQRTAGARVTKKKEKGTLMINTNANASNVKKETIRVGPRPSKATTKMTPRQPKPTMGEKKKKSIKAPAPAPAPKKLVVNKSLTQVDKDNKKQKKQQKISSSAARSASRKDVRRPPANSNSNSNSKKQKQKKPAAGGLGRMKKLFQRMKK